MKKPYIKLIRTFLLYVLILFVYFVLTFNIIFQKSYNYAKAVPSNAFCSSGQAFCTVGLFASCSDLSYSPKCVNDNFLDCCRRSGSSLDCMPEFLICSSVAPPVSSSSSGVVKSFCFNEEVVCDSGFPTCLEKSFSLTCVNNIPDCCKKKFDHLECRPELLTCVPKSDSLTIDRFNTVDLDVVTTPKLPEIVQLPLVVDAFRGRVGFTFNGSNPSFEIKLPVDDPNLKIVSVDLRDSNSMAFENVPFVTNNIKGTFKNLILSLNIPESVSKGELRFALNLNNSNSVTGIIQVINPFEVQEFFGEKIKEVLKPEINRIFLLRDNGTLTLILKGKNFVGKKIFFKDGDITSFLEKSKNDPITQVSVLPSNLNLEIQERKVFNKGIIMRVKLKLPQIIPKNTNVVIVISTPIGITSKSFVIK